jgi:hypothetical protein
VNPFINTPGRPRPADSVKAGRVWKRMWRTVTAAFRGRERHPLVMPSLYRTRLHRKYWRSWVAFVESKRLTDKGHKLPPGEGRFYNVYYAEDTFRILICHCGALVGKRDEDLKPFSHHMCRDLCPHCSAALQYMDDTGFMPGRL